MWKIDIFAVSEDAPNGSESVTSHYGELTVVNRWVVKSSQRTPYRHVEHCVSKVLKITAHLLNSHTSANHTFIKLRV